MAIKYKIGTAVLETPAEGICPVNIFTTLLKGILQRMQLQVFPKHINVQVEIKVEEK